MQSMKEMLKTVSFLRFIAVQTSDRHDDFGGVSQADRIADVQRHRGFNPPVVQKGAVRAEIRYYGASSLVVNAAVPGIDAAGLPLDADAWTFGRGAIPIMSGSAVIG